MKQQLSFGLAVATLLSSIAIAQTTTISGDKSSSDRPSAATSETPSATTSGPARERAERSSATGARSETNVRVGVESRGRENGLRERGVRSDRSDVEVRRRSVTTVSSAEPESRTVVRQGGVKKKVVIRKKKKGAHYVVRSRRNVVEEPSISVRRRSVRRIETSEPEVSVRTRTRTSVTRSQEESVRGGASIERRDTGARSTTQTGVSATTSRDNRANGQREGGNKPSGNSTTTGSSSTGATTTTSQPQR